jgi:hypothetical protein
MCNIIIVRILKPAEELKFTAIISSNAKRILVKHLMMKHIFYLTVKNSAEAIMHLLKCMSKITLIVSTVGIFGRLEAQDAASDVFVFSYFKNNGEDGLHLAYSFDGYTWHSLKNDKPFLKPAAGKDKLIRDPCIIQGPDSLFHMVWTVSWNERGIGYANSTDLIHWSKQSYIPVMEDEPAARNCWAPEIFYDAKTKQYAIYWATTVTGKFKETLQAKENSYNHRLYYVTTRDFKSFSKSKLLYDGGFNVIDATILHHDGAYLMFLKDETVEPAQKNIRIAVSKMLTSGYGKPGEPITGAYWAEGPTVAQLGDGWMVYFDKYRDKKMGAVFSPDLQVWTDVSGNVNFPPGVRHGSVFKISKELFNRLLEL